MYAGTYASKVEEFTQDQRSYRNTLHIIMCAEDEVRTFFVENGSKAKISEQTAISITDPGISEVLKQMTISQAQAQPAAE